jgi:hypothetical protein
MIVLRFKNAKSDSRELKKIMFGISRLGIEIPISYVGKMKKPNS